MLRVKGINVSPVEVEGVLARHTGVDAAYIVGLPVSGMEQRVVALIVSRSEDCRLLEKELAELAREQLSHYKRPEAYVFLKIEEVPFGATSKPQRAQLAEIAEKRLARA